MSWILLAHAAATLAMTGLIWFVQIVHYPLFRRVEGASFSAYEKAHVARTGIVVAPLMLVETATALVLAAGLDGPGRGLAVAGLALLAAVWGSTVLLQVPCHRRLERDGAARATIDRLVATNWIRTIAWTLRGVIALALLRATGAGP